MLVLRASPQGRRRIAEIDITPEQYELYVCQFPLDEICPHLTTAEKLFLRTGEVPGERGREVVRQ